MTLVTIPLSYREFVSPFDQSDPRAPVCSCCQEEIFRGQEAVAHDGTGTLHPFHRICVQRWARVCSTCPACRNPVDISSLFLDHLGDMEIPGTIVEIPDRERPTVSLRRRIIVELTFAKKDFFVGASLATVIGSVSTGLAFGIGVMCDAIDGPLTSTVLLERAHVGTMIGLPSGTGCGSVMQSIYEPLPEGYDRASSAAKAAISAARIATPLIMIGASFTTALMMTPSSSSSSYLSMVTSFAVAGVLTCLRNFFERRMAP